MTNRRESYSRRLAAQVETRGVGPAIDTLLTWENEVIPELAEVLVAAATGETPEIRLLPEALPERPTRTVVNDATYLFTDTGVVREVYVIREIEAVQDEVSEVEVSHSYINDPRPGVLNVEPYTNCWLISQRYTPAGYLHARLGIPTLRLRAKARISYMLRVASDIPCRPVIKITPRTHENAAIIRVQFNSAYLPQHLWRLRTASDTEAPEHPPPGPVLELSAAGYLEIQLSSLMPGLSQGLGWEWPSVEHS